MTELSCFKSASDNSQMRKDHGTFFNLLLITDNREELPVLQPLIRCCVSNMSMKVPTLYAEGGAAISPFPLLQAPSNGLSAQMSKPGIALLILTRTHAKLTSTVMLATIIVIAPIELRESNKRNKHWLQACARQGSFLLRSWQDPDDCSPALSLRSDSLCAANFHRSSEHSVDRDQNFYAVQVS